MMNTEKQIQSFRESYAAVRGADIRVRTEVMSARRADGRWRIDLRDTVSGRHETVEARSLVNATGAWVPDMMGQRIKARPIANVRLVKGSHIVVPRVHDRAHAVILQNPDGRVIFLIPYEEDYTEIGTTDVPIEGMDPPPACSREEIEYLCAAASRYTLRTVTADEVSSTSTVPVWLFFTCSVRSRSTTACMSRWACR